MRRRPPHRACRTAAALLLLLLATGARAEEVPASGGNFGGVGLLETRNARFREDGTLEAGASLRHQRRFWFVNFQALPFLETTFRLTERLNATTGRGFTTDRSFDLKLRLLREGDWTPAVAVGLQDFIGTGLYSGEYLVASKRWWGLDLSAGLGWGRLGTGGEWNNPLGYLHDGFDNRPRDVGRGGTLQRNWFRGEDVAPFAGIEWSVPPLGTPWGVVDGLRAKAEWSGDRLRDERGGYPARRDTGRGDAASRVNLGLQWSNDWLDAGLSFTHGTDLLLRVSLRMNPADPPRLPLPDPPPLPRRAAHVPASEAALAEAVFDALAQAGFTPLAFRQEEQTAEIAVEGGRFNGQPQVAARILRATEGLLPPGVEMLRIRWWLAGAEVAVLEIPRAVLEGTTTGRASPEEAWATARPLPATGAIPPGGFEPSDLDTSWGVEPRLALQLGDPTRTLRWQAGVAAGGRVSLGAGFSLAGSVQQALAGNLDQGPTSDSRLPHVRTDYGRYAAEGKFSIPALYGERIWNLAPDVFARGTVGLLEPMFGGASAEVLWRPFDRGFAVGLDLNWVKQRAFDGLLGLRNYQTTTGHLSVYADLPVWNLYGVVRAGRYLAGDWGATFELGRRFSSGIEVGGFATFTNVSAAQFGEGSFDKGLYVRVPLNLFGAESRGRGGVLIRPIQRDGGQRLSVDNPLWDVTREGRADMLRDGIAGFSR
ncbi:YjbH domain-containing protein [Roseomonas haemaphysalidis]|uniref:YjbH domain-containing protein n=1 Tax=Roseomonas haemaphysalidis TaxID=2768162 RepID=UPI001F3FB8F0|nr:YjbH domain-containing protein [Roseomonas haemaphysalidis]